MKLSYEVTMKFSVELRDSPLGEKEQTYDNWVKIKTFLDEFCKHPEALHSYYRSNFIDQYISNSANDWDSLCQQLNYSIDYVPLFTEIAQNCPPEIIDYITDLFSEETDDLQENNRKEHEKQILEDQLTPLHLIKAQFIST